ncbi:MAG: MotA/TolQ/ExbB proton channel family protein [candidate division Zixibacteria bacterium]|nr:MotA/TolQ/ExbB proton channel family protein [candidate division Zixibacteria bacterium]
MDYAIVAGIFSGSIWEIVAHTSAFGTFILLVLSFMSFFSWVIIFGKWRQFSAVEKANAAFMHYFKRSRSLADTLGQAKSQANSPMAQIYLAGYNELEELKESRNQGGALQETQNPLQLDDFEIVEMAMEKTLSDQATNIEKRVIFLATTANAAPFLGLLGTVVGIMDSFWAIGERGSASLAIVAPGIAEALLATIVGLGAAIPAVIAYNWANNKLKFINEFANSFILAFVARARKEAR